MGAASGRARHRAGPRDRSARPLLRRPRRGARAPRPGGHVRRPSACSTSSTTCSCPGLPSTAPFLEAVFGELADLFPGPWLHLGGDEVPAGAWAGSPAAQRYAGERGLAGTDAIAAAFMADVIGLVRTATGRQVGVWQEAAECGALQPGRRLRRRLEVERRLPPPRRRRVSGRRRAGRGVLPRHGERRRVAVAGRRAGPGARRSPTSRPTTSRPAGPPPSGPTSSASRPACGPSTSTTTPPSSTSSTPASTPSPPPPGRPNSGSDDGPAGFPVTQLSSESVGTSAVGSRHAPHRTVRADRARLDPGHLRRRRARRGQSGHGRPHPRPGRGGGHQPHRHRGVVRRGPRIACSRGSPTTATRSSSPPRPATGRATPPGPRSSVHSSGWASTTSTSIQLHNLVEPDEWEVAHGPGGAVEALARARDEGLTRFIGVTGHGLRIARMHRLSLEQFPFDSVLLPINFTLLGEPAYAADVEELLAVCARDEVAVQAIKAIARRRWSDDAGDPRYSWYEPLADPAAIGRAVRYVLSDPRLFLITSSDYRQLPATRRGRLGSARPAVRRRARRRRRGPRDRADLRRRDARAHLRTGTARPGEPVR